MKYLCIDAAGNSTSVGAVNGDKRIFLCDDGFVRASRALMPMIDDALERAAMRVDEADFIAVTIGPGSFTGIRIGLSTARALAYVVNKPIVSVNTCELAAYNNRSDKVLTALDAGNGFVFAALYENNKEIFPPRCVTFDEFKALRESCGECAVAADTKTAPILNVEATAGDGIIELAKEKFDRGEIADYRYVDAMYVRLSQAEKLSQ